MSVETCIRGIADRYAKGRQSQQSAFATGDSFWTRVDAAADETFENRLKGTDITALDTALAQAQFGNVAAVRVLPTLLNTYFQVDLGLAAPHIETYLTAKGWRVPFEFAQLWFEATGYRITSKWVFGKGTRVASGQDPASSGGHKFFTRVNTAGAEVQTVVNGALVNCTSPVVVTSDAATPAGSGHSATVTLSDGATTRDIAYTPSATQYGAVIVGQQAIGAAGAAAGQNDIPIAATAQFAAGTYVLAVKADYSVQELVLVDTITANTKLVAKTALVNSFAQNDLVLPLVTNCVHKAGSLANDRALTIWAWQDRIIAL